MISMISVDSTEPVQTHFLSLEIPNDNLSYGIFKRPANVLIRLRLCAG